MKNLILLLVFVSIGLSAFDAPDPKPQYKVIDCSTQRSAGCGNLIKE